MATKKDLNIQYVDTDSLIPYVNNARKHSDDQVSEIAASIKEFGFNNPVLIDGKKGIIAGHGRIAAAKKLGLEKVPVIELSHLSDAQRRAYILADNRLAEKAEWDFELVNIELEDIKLADIDVSLTGFELNDIGIEDAEIDMPDIPEGDKSEFVVRSFTLHDEQAKIVEEAIRRAKDSGALRTDLNPNKNGCALALICEEWMQTNG